MVLEDIADKRFCLLRRQVVCPSVCPWRWGIVITQVGILQI